MGAYVYVGQRLELISSDGISSLPIGIVNYLRSGIVAGDQCTVDFFWIW